MTNQGVMLPGMDAIRREKGRNEQAAEKTLENLRNQGLITGDDAALEALLTQAAMDVDAVKDDDAASGRSSLLKTYLAILHTVQDLAQRRKEAKAFEKGETPDAKVLKVIGQ